MADISGDGRVLALESKNTVDTVSSAIALAEQTISSLMGEELANTINSSAITRASLATIVASSIQNKFSKYSQAS